MAKSRGKAIPVPQPSRDSSAKKPFSPMLASGMEVGRQRSLLSDDGQLQRGPLEIVISEAAQPFLDRFEQAAQARGLTSDSTVLINALLGVLADDQVLLSALDAVERQSVTNGRLSRTAVSDEEA